MPDNTTIDDLLEIPEIRFTLHAFETEAAPFDNTMTKTDCAVDAEIAGEALDELNADIADAELGLMGDFLNTTPQTLTEQKQKDALEHFDVFNLIYPVGSIYINTTDVNPGTMFPNTTWTKVGAGRMLYAATAYEQAGLMGGTRKAIKPQTAYSTTPTQLTAAQTGIPNHTHVHTVKIPAHMHSVTQRKNWKLKFTLSTGLMRGVVSMETLSTLDSASQMENVIAVGGGGGRILDPTVTGLPVDGEISENAAVTRGNPHQHMIGPLGGDILLEPPYLAVNIWRRSA